MGEFLKIYDDGYGSSSFPALSFVLPMKAMQDRANTQRLGVFIS